VKGRAVLAAAALALLTAFVLGIAIIAAATGTLDTAADASAATASCTGSSAASTAETGQLTASQVSNAQVIYETGVSMGLPQQAEIIAIATARQESDLENIDYGTSDSLGLFQQRPSQGWGSPAQILQPAYAATKFYDALVQVPGWQSLPVTVAAQAVQHSAAPDAYAQWQSLAQALVQRFSGQQDACSTGNSTGIPAGGATALPSGFTLPAGTPSAVVTAIGYAADQLGKPYIWGGTGPEGYDCSGLVMMAYAAAGIGLPRTSEQQVDVGTPVYSLEQLRPGDLLFAAGSDGTASSPGHVGIYIGENLVIEAPETGEKIRVIPISTWWAKNTVAIRRIIQ
jgi:cell wall-associated NlpC family hydrolase